jgi:predicted N-formylglutamate amidohydrolase
MEREVFVVVTCEHAGNRVPARYGALFAGYEAMLASHRGYDPGALAMAREFASALDAPLFYCTTTRLLVELNRSPSHPGLFSEPVRRCLSAAERERLIERFYRPYREAVERKIHHAVLQGRQVVHLSCHSFTPCLDGVDRRADVGLLFHPGRAGEAALCAAWQAMLAETHTSLRVRRNYPYRGTADSFIACLRRRFSEGRYAGIQLEVNQKFALEERHRWGALRRSLITAFERALSRRSWERAAAKRPPARRADRPPSHAGRAVRA